MTSVRMTMALRERLVDNYRKQIQSAYNNNLNVDKAIDEIVSSVQTGAGYEFKELVLASEHLAEHLHNHAVKWHAHTKRTNGQTTISTIHVPYGREQNDKRDYMPIEKASELHVICNPNRPLTENFKACLEWNDRYTSKWEDDGVKEPSKTYVEGDLMFIHDFGDNPVYLPYLTVGTEQMYHAKEDYAPNCECAIVVSDPKLCAILENIPKAKVKASEMVKKFETFVEPITTLKKFLDVFPGGRSLVPEDVLKDMAAPAVKRKEPAKTVTAEELMPAELKQELNEVMLESSLLGD